MKFIKAFWLMAILVFITVSISSASSPAYQPGTLSFFPYGNWSQMYCAYQAVPFTLTDGQLAPVQCDSTGRLITNATGGGGSGGVSAYYNTTLPTFTNGSASNLQTDVNGRLLSTFGGVAQPIYFLSTPTINSQIQNSQLNVGPGVNDNGVNQQIVLCDQSQRINPSASGDTLEITGVAGKQIHICGWHYTASLQSNNVTLEVCTAASSCAGTIGLDGPLPNNPNGVTGINEGGGIGQLYVAPTGDGVGINLSAAGAIGGAIQYTIY